MDAVTWLETHASMPASNGEFACRKGCGFCCTYPPKVDEDQLAAIEEEHGRTPVAVDPHGNLRLPLQAGCGGCVLLEDRVCQAHDQRPDHCQFFPFHIYFGRTAEVIADRACPGIAPQGEAQGPHVAAGEAETWQAERSLPQAALDVLSSADPAELDRRARKAQAAHDRAAAQARRDDRWADIDVLIEQTRSDARITPRAWDQAAEPFTVEDEAQLPTAVLPDGKQFPWRAWRIEGNDLERLSFDEEGNMRRVDTQPAPVRPDNGQLAPAVEQVLQTLMQRELFVGLCMHLVEADELSVRQAVERRRDEIAAGLGLHAQLLEAEELPVAPAWLRSVYEPEFYSLATLGEWL